MTTQFTPEMAQFMEAMRAERAAERAQLVAEMRAERERERAELNKAPTGPPTGMVWADWERLILGLPAGHPKARADARECRIHKPMILDLPFEFDGQVIYLRDVPCEALTVRMVQAWRRALQLKPRKGGGSLSPSYRNRIMTTLQSVVRWYMGEAPSPIHGLEREDERGRKRTGCFLNEAHVEEFAAHLPAWLRLIVRIAIGPGCNRLQEVLYLEKSEIIWSAQRISLPAHRCKNRVPRNFAVSDTNFKALALVCQASPSPVHVFVKHGRKKDGTTWSTGYVQHLMREAARKSGIRLGPKGEIPTFHYLRRTGATFRLEKDAEGGGAGGIKGLMEEGGWLTPSVASSYLDMTPSNMEASARMANVSVEVARQMRRERMEAGIQSHTAQSRRRATRRG